VAVIPLRTSNKMILKEKSSHEESQVKTDPLAKVDRKTGSWTPPPNERIKKKSRHWRGDFTAGNRASGSNPAGNEITAPRLTAERKNKKQICLSG
jgi:hypothetical protein